MWFSLHGATPALYRLINEVLVARKLSHEETGSSVHSNMFDDGLCVVYHPASSSKILDIAPKGITAGFPPNYHEN